MRTGDWMRLRCGDKVREEDGRHTGRVEAIEHGAVVHVRWHGTGWLTEFDLHVDHLVATRQNRGFPPYEVRSWR